MNILIEATLDKLVADIEAGHLDWRKTWTGGGMPSNHTTKASYRGINVLLLWAAQQNKGYATAKWATYKQWKAAGYQVNGGEQSATIMIVKDAVKKEAGTEDQHYKMFKCAFVFNAAQLTAPPAAEVMVPITIEERHALCAATVASTGAGIIAGDRPVYSPSIDVIGMPPIDKFISADAYYATLFHELIHWTMPTRRCDRKAWAETTKEAYAFEELVAEIGAAFLCSTHQVDETPDHNNHAAYLQTWLRAIKTDKAGALMKAASAATKAMQFIEARAAAPLAVAA